MANTGRSPSYPNEPLEKSIQRAFDFYKANGKYAVERSDKSPAAFHSIGYTGASGAAKTALATMLGYGLLEKAGGPEGSKVKLSDIGFNIVALPEDDPEHSGSIKQAAMRPKVYQDLLREFPHGLPNSDSPLQSYLVRSGYLPAVIPGLIQDFRATVAFAKLFDSGNIDPIGETQTPRVDDPPADNPTDKASDEGVKPRKGTMTYTIPMPEQRQATLQVPVPLTDKDFTFLTTYLALMKDAMVGEVSPETRNLAEPDDE